MPSKQKILAELEESRADVLRYLDTLPEAAWDVAENGNWSPAVIAAHVASVEAATLTGLRRAEAEEGPHRKLTFRERVLGIPPALIRYPLIKVEAPSWVRPEGTPTREEVKRKLLAVRRELLTYLASRSDDDLDSLAVRHPFFGWMSAAHLLRLLAAHDARHLVQMRRAVEEALKKPRARAVAA